GTGFRNDSSLTTNGEQLDADACAPFPIVSVLKTLVGTPEYDGLGGAIIDYDVTVTNTGAGATTYDLTDELRFGVGATILDAAVTNTTPGGIVTNPDWDGVIDTAVVTAQPIAAAGSHVYRIRLTADIDASMATSTSSDCTLDQDETRTGWLNQAGLTVNGVDSSASDCAPFPILHVTKSVVDGPMGQGDGTLRITYAVTVSNTGTAQGSYDLDDDLRFGSGVSVVAAAVVNTAPGTIVTDPTFDGQTHARVVTSQPIDAGTEHVYQVTVTAVTDPTAATSVSSDCTLDDGATGTGLRNEAAMTESGVPVTVSACAPFAILTIAKTVAGEPVSDTLGNVSVAYDVTVTNAGAVDAVYDLDDALRFGADVTVQTATVSNSLPGTIATNGVWDGSTDTIVVADQPITAASSHVYRVTVTALVGIGATDTDAACDLGQGEIGTGLRNVATLGDNGTATDAAACAAFALPDPIMRVVKVVTQAPIADAQRRYTVRYSITVTNDGRATTYDLSDQLRYGAGVEVTAASVLSLDPTGIDTRPDWDGTSQQLVATDVAIGIAETHVFQVTVTVAIHGGDRTESSSDCDLGSGESGTGLLNTATLVVEGGTVTTTDDACVAISELPATDTLSLLDPSQGGQDMLPTLGLLLAALLGGVAYWFGWRPRRREFGVDPS
ncbi:MAG: hypothetical protein LH650_06335, partial [Chloroflexi bacterium]|nr:hypothetical protein [Chloroflexota bacterium]